MAATDVFRRLPGSSDGGSRTEAELQPSPCSLEHETGRSSFTPGKVTAHTTSLSWQNQAELAGTTSSAINSHDGKGCSRRQQSCLLHPKHTPNSLAKSKPLQEKEVALRAATPGLCPAPTSATTVLMLHHQGHWSQRGHQSSQGLCGTFSN